MIRSIDEYFWQPLNAFFERRSMLFFMVAGPVLVAIIGTLDYLIDPELSIFFLIPIGLGVWYGDLLVGVLLSLASIFIWQLVDLGRDYQLPLQFSYWSAVVRLGFFLIVSYLLSRLRAALEREKRLARFDPLTGAANRRTFLETAGLEIKRVQRSPRPLTIAYIDLDSFKAVNDQLGHTAGDQVLCRVVEVLRRNTRATDVVARLGGDEFALLLPETDVAGAESTLAKLRGLLLAAMNERGWPVRFSIGAVTLLQSSRELNVEEVIQRADRLMYAVKQNGKDSIRCEVM